MSRPSFPLTVPCPGAPFAPRGPFGSVPPLPRYYGALRLPVAPALASLALRSAVPSIQRRRRRASQVPRRPSPRMPRLFDPGGTSGAGLRDSRPYVSLLRCCLPSPPTRRLPRLEHFGVQFRSLRARCLRFAARVAPTPRKTRFRLAALPWPGGSSTRWVALQVSALLWLTWLPPGRGLLGARSAVPVRLEVTRVRVR